MENNFEILPLENIGKTQISRFWWINARCTFLASSKSLIASEYSLSTNSRYGTKFNRFNHFLCVSFYILHIFNISEKVRAENMQWKPIEAIKLLEFTR